MEKQLTRKEIYSLIKSNNLQEEVKKTFGKNYTNVSTQKLSNFFSKLSKKENTNEKECTEKKRKIKPIHEINPIHEVCCADVDIEGIQELFVLLKLVNILRKKNILLASELDAIFDNYPPKCF